MIKLLISSVTSDGENITINFIGARNIKDDFSNRGELQTKF